jgi:hypothetical protein
MFRTRFSPITARPIRPMSAVALGDFIFDGLNLSGKFEGFAPRAYALDGLATDSESLTPIDIDSES